MSKGTYVAYTVLNHDQVRNFYSKQGIEIDPELKLHVTLAFSRKEFTPTLERTKILPINPMFYTEHKRLGDSLVLTFRNRYLDTKFEEFLKLGATWDHENYDPHVTIIYDTLNESYEIPELELPDFPIILGSPYVEELEIK